MSDLPKAAIIRIAKKNGIERVGADAADAMVIEAEKFVASLALEANKLAGHAGRKTLKMEDIEMARGGQ